MTEARRRRLLVLAPRSVYINPTEEDFLARLAERFDVVFHGPGWGPIDQLAPDAEAAYERLGPFDAAILHQYFLMDSLSQAAASCHFPFDVRRFLRERPTFAAGFAALPCLRIAMLMRMDYYALTARDAERLQAFPGCFLTWPAEFTPPLADVADIGREAFAGAATDHYHRFAAANRRRIIPTAHAVEESLIIPPRLADKRYDVSVPGQFYAARKEAAQALRAAGFRVGDQSQRVGLFSRAATLLTGRSLYASPRAIARLQRSFQARIRNSLVCYTDGSRLRWPLRKYFEIPALGALLAADRFHGDEALGFVAGRNYLAVAPAELPDVVRRAKSDPDWAFGMVGRLQDALRARHTVARRVEQFAEAVEALLDGAFAGAGWRNGAFVVERRQAARAAPHG